jgi:hypothetical protein
MLVCKFIFTFRYYGGNIADQEYTYPVADHADCWSCARKEISNIMIRNGVVGESDRVELLNVRLEGFK